jgi:hypothetical protein
MNRLLHFSLLLFLLSQVICFRDHFTISDSNQPVTCIGITTKGKPCKNPPKSGSSYCFWHDPSRLTCEGINSAGKRCSNSPVVGTKYCAVHDPKRLKCKALNSRGLPCQNSPIANSGYCQDHLN